MNTLKKITIFFFPIIFWAICLSANEWDDILKKAKKTEQTVDFYGRVLDQKEYPVEGANVLYKISAYGFPKPLYKIGKVQTDKDGKFEIHGGKAAILYIDSIELKGHEFKRGKEKTMFHYARDYYEIHSPEKNNPIVFHLRRKMTEAVVLLDRKMTVSFHKDKDEMWWGWDLLETKHGTLKNKGNPERHWDIEATGNVNPEKEEWTVTFRMNGEKAGMCFSDDFLYEAPLKGYETEIVKSFKFNKNNIGNRDIFPVRHLYLKIRDVMLYARLDVNTYYADENRFSLRFEGNLNPYGSRSLEPLLFIEGHGKITTQSASLFNQTERIALEALRQNRLPEKPDFEQWVKDGLAKY